jgi:beta-lactamase regulating signal transducer with metallopeptidase domain
MPAAPALLRIEHQVPAVAPPEVRSLPASTTEPATAAEPAVVSSIGATAPVRTISVSLRAGAWPARIFGLWLAVFLLQLGRIAYSYAYLRGIKGRALRATPEMRHGFDAWVLACGIHRPAQLLISREIVSPMAIGFRSPAVIVPEGLLAEFSGGELDHVLLHELAHLARRDDCTNLAWRISWALLVLHPAAVWVMRQIEREREIACDDWVVAATGEARPYATSLARLFEVCLRRRRALLATGMVEHGSQLGDRIEMLLRRQREFKPRASATRVALGMAVVLAFLAVAAQTPAWIALAQDVPQARALSEGLPPSAEPPAPPAALRAAAEPIPTAAPKPVHRLGSTALVALQTPSPVTAVPVPPPAKGKASFLAALVAAGYGNLPVDDIIALKTSGISAEFLTAVRETGWGKLTPQEMIDLHNHSVSPQFLNQMREAGLSGLSVQEVIDLRNNGVDPVWVREIESAGLGSYTTAQLIDFRRNGVSADLLRALKDAGFVNVEPREIIQLRQSGVGRRNLEEAHHYGPSLTVKQIIRLKQAGVI